MNAQTNSHEQLENYFELVDTLAQLEQMQDDATDIVRPTIDASIKAAKTRISEAEGDPSIRSALFSLASTALKSLEQIDALQPAARLGLVDQSELEERKAEISDNPHTQRAIEVFKRSGLISSTLEIDQDSASQDSSVKTDREPSNPAISITIEGDGVQIGKQGRYIKLSKAYASDQRDYSEERKAVLKVLVENAGQELTVGDLWRAAFEGKQPFDRVAMRQVRVWLESLTYRRSPIVTHNGKRGQSSAYSIQNPNVTISEVSTTRPVSRAAEPEAHAPHPQPEETMANVTVDATIEDEPEASTPGASKAIEEVQPVVHFPLNHAESTILAEFLTLNKEILSEQDIPAPQADIGKRLSEGLEASKLIIELSPYFGSLEEARTAILRKVIDYFKESEKVLADIKNMPVLDNRFELFEYLFGFDDEDREYLLDTLAKSVPVTEVFTSRGSFSSGVQIIEANGFRLAPDGRRLGLSNDEEATESAHTTPEAEESQVSNTHYIDEDQLAAPAEAATEANDTKIEQFERELREHVQEVLDLVKHFSLEGKSRRSVQGVEGFGFLTTRFVKNAAENGLISRDSKNLMKRDIVILSIQHHFSEAMSVRSSKSKPNRRLINSIVDERLNAES